MRQIPLRIVRAGKSSLLDFSGHREGKRRGSCSIPWVPMPRSGMQSISIAVSYWITLPLAVLAAAFLVRIFIIFHDCGHGSFYASRSANRIVGFITGLLTLTPYHHWRWQHALHHGTSGDLDRRGAGDIWMLTVQEYLDSSRWRRRPHRSWSRTNPASRCTSGP